MPICVILIGKIIESIDMEVRTRFAPSPTGYMHIGNLRTALYAYLFAKNKNGKFILRIEDTDQNRYVENAVDIIYNTLKSTNLNWDEGPDIGGEYSPYIQSERVKSNIYLKYALQLVEQGDAYYCFCKDCHSDLERYMTDIVHYGLKEGTKDTLGYDGHCRHLTKEEIEENLKNNKPFVIRQKILNDVEVSFEDEVFGLIKVNSKDLDDQVLIKQDGYPTYNFANVIDDHLMNITHVIRGCEYLSSTPKYNLLYKAFGWKIPTYIHLPLIMRQNEKGDVEKLSKRNGSVSFEDFINQGYLSEAIINYIGLLGWSPKTNNEFLTLDDFIKQFNVKGINKSPTIFDEKKLKWINGKYIRNLSIDNFKKVAYKFSNIENTFLDKYWDLLAKSLQNRIETLSDIPNHLELFFNVKEHSLNMYNIERIGLYINIAKNIIKDVINYLKTENDVYKLKDIMFEKYKKAQVLSVLRIALTGRETVALDMFDIMYILGKDECLTRIEADYTQN